MRIIPVIDLLSGNVVQGIGGQRTIYQPIKDSVITDSIEPITVVKDIYRKLQLDLFYIADLDSIQRKEAISIKDNPNYPQIVEIVKNPQFKVMIDCGCQTIDDITDILSLGIDHVILGTETIDSPIILDQAVEAFGAEKIILSLDFQGGNLLANSERMKEISPVKLAKHAEKLGINAIIVLELQKVGSQSGPLNQHLIDIASQINAIPVYSGGGVRSIQDLAILKENNVEGALIATAFHKGTIKKEEIEEFLSSK